MSDARCVDQAAARATRAEPLRLCDGGGAAVITDGRRWLGPATAADERLLDRAIPPVLDVGCGPARLVVALSRRGVSGMGIDVTPFAVRLARSRGAPVVKGSIFGTVPDAGTWGTALLVDGNIGIGGDPAALLTTVASVVRPGGRILVELGSSETTAAADWVRMTYGASTGPWFQWAAVGVDSLDSLLSDVGLQSATTWSDDGRWFAQIDTPGRTRRCR